MHKRTGKTQGGHEIQLLEVSDSVYLVTTKVPQTTIVVYKKMYTNKEAADKDFDWLCFEEEK